MEGSMLQRTNKLERLATGFFPLPSPYTSWKNSQSLGNTLFPASSQLYNSYNIFSSALIWARKKTRPRTAATRKTLNNNPAIPAVNLRVYNLVSVE
jgi:hypothetical protein